jgi:hypothetical protein
MINKREVKREADEYRYLAKEIQEFILFFEVKIIFMTKGFKY